MSGRLYSLSGRLILWLATGGIVLWVVTFAVTVALIRHELDEAFDSALQETAQQILPLAVTSIEDRGGGARELIVPPGHKEFLTYLVRDREGKILMRSHDAQPELFPPKPQTGFITTSQHRIYGESGIQGTLFVEVAEPLRHRVEAATETTFGSLLALAIMLPLGLLGIRVIVRRAIRPVHELRLQIGERRAGNLAPLNDPSLPIELAPIADAVSQLMERLGRSLEAERTFSANCAHELRTPIAGALAQIQNLLPSLPQGNLRKQGSEIEMSIRRFGRIAEQLMQLARAEGGLLLSPEPTDLAPVLRHVIDEFERDSRLSGRLVFSSEHEGPLKSRLDVDAFGILMRNLIENALRHGAGEEPTEVRIDSAGLIHVINDCPILAAEELATISRAFVRGPRSTEGAGLGLAIVHALVRSAGLGLHLDSPPQGRKTGFEAILRPWPEADGTNPTKSRTSGP